MEQQMITYTLEVYDYHSAATVGFHNVTAPDEEAMERLARQLITVLGEASTACLDWTCVAETPR